MSEPRIRVADALSVGQTLVLPSDEAHHLLQVLRMGVGSTVEVVDGNEVCFASTISGLHPAEILVDAALPLAHVANPRASIEFWVPLLKGGRTADVIRQLVEVGVGSLVVFSSERSVARLNESRRHTRIERWETIVEQATKQCGRTDLPSVRFHVGIPGELEGGGVFFWEQASQLAASVLKETRLTRVLVGPEGGLSVSEASALKDTGWRSAWLGARVLRAETACVVTATLAMSALGEGGY